MLKIIFLSYLRVIEVHRVIVNVVGSGVRVAGALRRRSTDGLFGLAPQGVKLINLDAEIIVVYRVPLLYVLDDRIVRGGRRIGIIIRDLVAQIRVQDAEIALLRGGWSILGKVPEVVLLLVQAVAPPQDEYDVVIIIGWG